MSPIMHPVIDVFLLGFLSACGLVAALFFFRFWRSTRDLLFLAFAFFFLLTAGGSAWTVTRDHPNWGNLSFSILRLLSILFILAAIYWKNSRKD